jgi:hypothetical protein
MLTTFISNKINIKAIFLYLLVRVRICVEWQITEWFLSSIILFFDFKLDFSLLHFLVFYLWTNLKVLLVFDGSKT